jgi:glycerol-3-phosphate dehydrogenase
MSKTNSLNIDKKIIKTDILIIGAGLIGASIAYELAKFNLKVLVLEKNNFVGSETSFGNSGMIHGGFDAETGTEKAFHNMRGKKL